MPTPINKHFLFSHGLLEQVQNEENKTSELEYAISFMQQNLEPEDIFSEKQLSNWAEAAGWVKP